MTTVAFKNGTISVDSKITEPSYAIHCDAIKMGITDDEVLIVVGDAGRQDSIIDAFVSITTIRGTYEQDLGLFPPDTRLIIYEKSTKQVTEVYRRVGEDTISYYTYPQNTIVAFGSGAKFAMGAMMAGASTAKSVEISSKLDLRTGGPIHTFTSHECWVKIRENVDEN